MNAFAMLFDMTRMNRRATLIERIYLLKAYRRVRYYPELGAKITLHMIKCLNVYNVGAK